jgi:hypothetical protein
MACIQYPRKERGGVSLGSWEKPTIYKEPLKEVFTKKKERIEEGDITYNIRNDPSRYNDSISKWQKGSNMMVEVDYQNRAPQTTTMNFGSASNPYKVNKAFRPPEFSLLDLQPLSRQKRPYVSGQTNIGSLLTRDDHSDIRIDNTEVEFAVEENREYHEENTNIAREIGVYHDNFKRTDMIGDRQYHEENTIASREIGVYHDNFKHNDMINEDYVAKQVFSQLKGLDSVEMQKLFQYENTPNGIIITPLSIIAHTSVSGGIKDVEAQRYINEVSSTIQDTFVYGKGTNQKGALQYDNQRHVSEAPSIIQDVFVYGQGTNQNGPLQYDAHMQLSEQNVYIHEDGGLRFGVSTHQNGNIKLNGPVQVEAHTINRIQIGQGTNTLGVVHTNGQQYLPDTDSHMVQRLHVGQGTNTLGVVHTNGQQYLPDTDAHTVQRLHVGQGTNVLGVVNTSGQQYLPDTDTHMVQRLHVGQGTNALGVVNTNGQQYLPDTDAHMVQRLHVGQGTNTLGVVNTNGQQYLPDTDAHMVQRLHVGQGTNQKGTMSIAALTERQEQMKDVLLKNMSSSLHIVIYQSGQEVPIQGSIHDKINIVVNSSKGQPITISRENGEPVRLKEYTWKFVKSASGSDKFVIQLQDQVHTQLELERKGELYAVCSNPGQAINQPEAEEVNLRRQMRHMSAATNLVAQEDIPRVDESIMRRIEKITHYTDHMIPSNSIGDERINPILSIKTHESSKKQNIAQTILRQSEGRF